MKIAPCFFLLSGLLAGIAHATTYYVSPNGANTTGLSESTAFRTPDQALSLLAPGDTVLVMNGTYYGEIFANSAKDVRFRNNILFARTGRKLNSGPNLSQVSFEFNLYFNGTPAYQGTGDRVANPLFLNASVDPQSADFRLQATSPAIDRGKGSPAAAIDFLKVSRPQGAAIDVGAYERQVTVP